MAQLSFLDVDNRLAALSADNPLRSAKGGTKLKARGFRSRIHGRGSGSNHPLSPSQRKPTAKGKGPATVSSTSSGAQENTQGGAAGSCAPSASYGRAPRSVCRTSATIPEPGGPRAGCRGREVASDQGPARAIGHTAPTASSVHHPQKNRGATHHGPLRLEKP
jgi:hypothetical protein